MAKSIVLGDEAQRSHCGVFNAYIAPSIPTLSAVHGLLRDAKLLCPHHVVAEGSGIAGRW